MKMKIIQDFSFEQLWDFYLEANFIYKQKLDSLRDNLEEIKDTWDKLLQSDDKVNHTSLRVDDTGKPSNSVSLVRYYNTTWILQHLVSSKDPVGMQKVLDYSILFLINNPSAQFAKFYWRPNNYVANLMFDSMKLNLEKAQNNYLYELFEYFEVTKKTLSQLKIVEDEFVSEIVSFGSLPKIASILKDNQKAILLESDSLTMEDLSMEKTTKDFERNGLKRDRAFIVVKKDAEIMAISAVENSSIGINLSYYFNKFTIYYLSSSLSNNQKEKVLKKLLKEIGFYYERQTTRSSLVTMCPKDISETFTTIGFNPIKQYKCLTIPKANCGNSQHGGFYQVLTFIRDFYSKKIY